LYLDEENVEFDKKPAERNTETILDRAHRLRGQPVPSPVWKNDLDTLHLLTDSADRYVERFTRSGEWVKEEKEKAFLDVTRLGHHCQLLQLWHTPSCPDPIDESHVGRKKLNFS
jgi:hypothetical protein